MVRKQTMVTHVGPYGDRPGGMAQVIRQISSTAVPGVRQEQIGTLRYRHDPLQGIFFIICMIRLLKSALERQRPWIVIVHLSERGSFFREGFVLILAKKLGAYAVAYLHGANFPEFAERNPWLVSKVLESATEICTLDHRTEHALSILSPTIAHRSRRVRNAVSVMPCPTWDERVNRIIFCGELSRRKGIDLLVDAWGELAALYPEWSILAIGPSTTTTPEEEFLPPRLALHGPLPNTELREEMRHSKIFTLPSRNEALPVALLEAMEAGCAVVVSDAGQMRDVVSPENGVVVDADAKSLEAGLRQALRDPECLREMGRASREVILGGYNADTVAATLVSEWVNSALTMADSA